MGKSYLLRCAVAGAIWGCIAWLLGHQAFRGLVYAGVLASPLVGLAVGWATFGLRHSSAWTRMAAAGLTLYGAATLFGLALGLAALLSRAPGQNAEVFIEPLFAVLWGVTFTGYFVVLWPLAYLTQAWVLDAAGTDTD
jgi:hypothetical protein